MIDLERAKKPPVGIAVCGSVQPGSQNHVLTHTLFDGRDKLILRESTPGHQKRTQIARESALSPAVRPRPNRLGGFLPDDPEREGIVQHRRVIENLVGRAALGHPPRGPAGTLIHRKNVSDIPPSPTGGNVS